MSDCALDLHLDKAQVLRLDLLSALELMLREFPHLLRRDELGILGVDLGGNVVDETVSLGGFATSDLIIKALSENGSCLARGRIRTCSVSHIFLLYEYE